MKQFVVVLSICFVALLGSCTVGPDYKQPQQRVPDQWQQVSDAMVDEAVVRDWWLQFGDPNLAEMVTRVQMVGFDVRTAQARLAEARAGLAAALGERLPELNAQVAAQRAKASENGQEPAATFFEQGLASPYQSLYQLGFDASWELDLFGRMRRGSEAAAARMDAALAGVAQTRLTLSAEVARLYFIHRGLVQREAVLQRRLDLRQQIAELVNVRREAGLAADLEVAQSRALVAQAEVLLPNIWAEREAVVHGLAALLDWPVAEVQQRLQADVAVDLPQQVAVETPAGLLQRRPDVVLAERQLAAATADIGVAEGLLWPRVSLGALFGLEASSTGQLFDSGSFQGMLRPQVSIPIFNRNRIRAGIAAAEARGDAALSAYEQAVALAVRDVGTAIARFEGQRLSAQKLESAEQEGTRALEMARVLYDKGLQDLLLVLDSERTLTEIQEGRIQAQTQAFVASVALFKALGGGWSESPM